MKSWVQFMPPPGTASGGDPDGFEVTEEVLVGIMTNATELGSPETWSTEPDASGGYQEFACPYCGAEVFVHRTDPDEAELDCPACMQSFEAKAARKPE